MIKLEIRRGEGCYLKPGTFVYEVIGIKGKRLCLNLLELKLDSGDKKECWHRQNPSFKIFYNTTIGNYIVSPETREKIAVDGVIKELFDEFYIKD